MGIVAKVGDFKITGANMAFAQTWILILTIANFNGISTVSAPPFHTKEACIEAGNIWKKQADSTPRVVSASFICVKDI